MCYYNGILVDRAEYIRLVNLEKAIGEMTALMHRPIMNGFEYGNWPIVKPVNGGADFELAVGHWEFLSPWSKTWADVAEGRKKYTTLNAKGEDLLTSKLYRDAALKRRCLVLSSGFFEWRDFKPAESKKALKYPYHISLQDKEYFYMAGIWQPWTDRETGETFDSFAIVTTAANHLMEQVHNTKKRMPTILPDRLALEWIQDGLSEERITQLATNQYPTEQMQAYTINKDFRTMPDPNVPFTYEELSILA